MALGKDKTRIFKIGGGYLSLKELPSGSFLDIGYIEGSKIIETIEDEDDYDERGYQVASLDGNTTAEFQSVMKQASMDEINLIRNSAGKHYSLRYYVVREDGTVHMIEAAYCKIVRALEVPFDNTKRLIPIRIKLLYDDTQASHWDQAEGSNDPPLEADWPYGT